MRALINDAVDAVGRRPRGRLLADGARGARRWLGTVGAMAPVATPLDTEDRRVLEEEIFPHLVADGSLQRVLFVGCDFYTRHYPHVFRSKEFWTIEPDPERSRESGGKRRVVDRLERVAEHFDEGYFDVIICNGVFGFGLDTPQATDEAFDGCFRVLRPRGLLIHGWNDRDDLRPFDPRASASLQRFTPHVFEPLGSANYLTDTPGRHTFDFYTR